MSLVVGLDECAASCSFAITTRSAGLRPHSSDIHSKVLDKMIRYVVINPNGRGTAMIRGLYSKDRQLANPSRHKCCGHIIDNILQHRTCSFVQENHGKSYTLSSYIHGATNVNRRFSHVYNSKWIYELYIHSRCCHDFSLSMPTRK